MATSIPSPARGKSWIWEVTMLCIVLGGLLALSLRTQRQAVYEGVPNRLPALKAEFRALKQENDNLQKSLADINTRYQKIVRERSEGLTSSKSLGQALNDAKVLAGLVAVRGPGIIVTVHDSPKLDPAETRQDVIENYVVHDYDIRGITNELYSAGAEAIAVNGQRLVATSSIRCVGAVVLVNSVQIAPPYVIKAVGKADVLEKALELRGGVADGLFLLDMIEIRKQPGIYVPAYVGGTRFVVARPVEGR